MQSLTDRHYLTDLPALNTNKKNQEEIKTKPDSAANQKHDCRNMMLKNLHIQ